MSQFLDIPERFSRASSPSVCSLLTPPREEPLLGSPLSFAIWEPRYWKQNEFSGHCSLPRLKSVTRVKCSDFLQTLNVDEIGDLALLKKLLFTMRDWDNRLELMICDTRQMRLQVWLLAAILDDLLANVDAKIRSAENLRTNLLDRKYMDKIIAILNGITPTNNCKWPFYLGRTFEQIEDEINLVV